MRVRDHQLDAAQATTDHALEESCPVRLGFARADVQPDDLPLALAVYRHSDYRRHRDDAAAFPLLEIGGVQPKIRPLAGERAVEEGTDPLVDVLAQPGDLALADPGQPHRLHHVVNPARRDAADPGFLDHHHQRLLGGPPQLKKGRKVAALPQFRNA